MSYNRAWVGFERERYYVIRTGLRSLIMLALLPVTQFTTYIVVLPEYRPPYLRLPKFLATNTFLAVVICIMRVIYPSPSNFNTLCSRFSNTAYYIFCAYIIRYVT